VRAVKQIFDYIQCIKEHKGQYFYIIPQYFTPANGNGFLSLGMTRGGSLIGTVELRHPLLPLDIIDNI
jgi:hypothetical protein